MNSLKKVDGMLILTRKEGEKIRIGEQVILCVLKIRGNKVRLGIQAPSETLIQREEGEVPEKIDNGFKA